MTTENEAVVELEGPEGEEALPPSIPPASVEVTVPLEALRWIRYGDTDISSMTIWGVLTGAVTPETPEVKSFKPFHPGGSNWFCVPTDVQSFRVCVRLLKRVPQWRSRLGEVAAIFPEWAKLVEEWDQIEAVLEKAEYADAQYCKASDMIRDAVGLDRLRGRPKARRAKPKQAGGGETLADAAGTAVEAARAAVAEIEEVGF